jgi:hypothetical protein
MANQYLTIALITYEMLLVLHNNVVAGKKVTRKYEGQFAKTGAKVGQLINVRKPPRYVVVDGAQFVAQDYGDEQVPLRVDRHKQVGCAFANTDLTLSMDDFSGRFLRPALVPLANQVDVDILAGAMQGNVYNATGTPGTVAATDTPFIDANSKLFNAAALMTEDMPMLTTSKVSGRLSSALAGRFNPTKQITDLYMKGSVSGYMKGAQGHALNWDFFMSQNMPIHTTGAWAGTPLVNGANQTGASITIDGLTGTVAAMGKKNDVIQFQDVYGLNPVTKLSTGELQDFVLTADCDCASGEMTVTIDPPITLVGKDATVSASPADGAAVTVWGTATVANVASKTSPQCLGWQPEAITLACIDFELPDEGEGVRATRVSDSDLGLSFTFMRAFNIESFNKISRIDILYGLGYLRPEHVVRVAS